MTSDVSLTPRQLEILALVSRGLSNPAIGSVLGITRGSVKLHLYRAAERLLLPPGDKACTRALLTAYFVRNYELKRKHTR